LSSPASSGACRDAKSLTALDSNAELAFLRDRTDYRQFRAGLK
jgi:hypothetical protein